MKRVCVDRFVSRGSRDIRAAILREVDGLTNRQIAQALCINTPSDFLIKGDHPTVRKMVRRGRRALVAALREEGW
jgi:DNA-directed RNA polymerase specialized sigma24 family protein